MYKRQAEDGNEPAPRPPVDPIQPSEPPPDLPKHSIHKVPNFIPGGDSIGKAPERIERTGSVLVDLGSVNIPRRAMPIGRLNVAYPPQLAEEGIEGSCEVRFSLNPQGEAYGINAVCTHAGFEKSARRAVSKARFSPRVQGGQQVAQEGMIYPIEYRLESEE